MKKEEAGEQKSTGLDVGGEGRGGDQAGEVTVWSDCGVQGFWGRWGKGLGGWWLQGGEGRGGA